MARMKGIDLLRMDCAGCIPQHTEHTHYLRGITGDDIMVLQKYNAIMQQCGKYVTVPGTGGVLKGHAPPEARPLFICVNSYLRTHRHD